MIEWVKKTFYITPKRWLVDNGYFKLKDIETASLMGCKLYQPLDKQKIEIASKSSSPFIREWKKRMEGSKGNEIYKRRSSSAELSNAQARNRGLEQFLVRGQKKVLCIAQLFAIANNMVRFFATCL